MPHYPKSQIKTNLYTNGGEYYTQDGLDYKGFYYTLFSGVSYSGKNPQDLPSILIIPYSLQQPLNQDNTNDDTITLSFAVEGLNDGDLTYPYDPDLSSQYTNLNNSYRKRIIPTYIPEIPTQQDYQLGVFTRYFCKKNNELKYLEIDKKYYNLLKSKSKKIAWDLYSPLYTLWYLTGDKNNIIKTNKGLINKIEKTQQWYGFSQYLKEDYSKYYLAS